MKNIILIVLMLPMVALSDPEPWMKKENPNELPIIIYSADTCPSTTKKYREIAEGVLIRSRIKPVEQAGLNELALQINLKCIDAGENNWLISQGVNFAMVTRDEHGSYLLTRLFLEDYGFFGQTGRSGSEVIEQSLREAVEDAITDYLLANFDLGEDE